MPAALDQLHVLEVGSGVAAAYAAKLLADHPFIGRGGALQINEPAAF